MPMSPRSSPLARGLLSRRPRTEPIPRIIPARAGFTPSTRWVEGPLRDHPRSRGVYLVTVSMVVLIPGSSPLARGLRRWITHEVLPSRIIPARAGFTGGFSWNCVWRADHPRSRGVYM